MGRELRLLVFNGTHEGESEQPYGAEVLRKFGIELIRPHPRGWVPTKLHQVVHHRWGLQLSQLRLAPLWRVDAVLAYLEPNMGFPVLARRIPGATFRSKPLWGIFCWAADDLASGSSAQRQAALRLLRGCDHVVCFSSNQVPIFVTAGIDPARIHVVPFGVDTKAVRDVRRSRDIDVLAVGWDRGRDYQTLADAVRGTGCRVDLVTKPEALLGVELAPEIYLRGTVSFSAYLDLLARSKVVVVPTRVLAYPSGQSVALEAAAAGCAVIVSDTPAMREYFVPDDTAIMPTAGDSDALRNAIGQLLHNADRRDALAHRARVHVSKSHDQEHMWAALSEMLKDSASAVE